MFLVQLNDWLIYILFAAIILTIWHQEYIDAAIISFVIIINAVLGVVQEYRAGKAVEILRNMTAPQAIVRRDGKTLEISAQDVTIGDIVLLDAGRIVPADIRLIESQELQIEESALTGESVPTKKNANEIFSDPKTTIGDQKNMAFMSTVVTAGRGVGVVVNIGLSTEMGHIANILENEESVQTPLEKNLEQLGKTLGKMAIAICLVIFVVGYFQNRDLNEIFLLSVSLAVASIPEGLAAIVAVVLSIGVTKMSKKNAIVKRLVAVETLGSVNIICSDKTGTLTQNKMTVVEFFVNANSTRVAIDMPKNPELMRLSEGMTLCSDATYDDGISTGDPTEVALLVFSDELGINRKKLAENFTRIGEAPFDSDRKMMSVLLQNNSQKSEKIIYTKGAVDNILDISTHILENGEIRELTDEKRKMYLRAMSAMSDKALRTLGLAYRVLSENFSENISATEMEKNLIFVGLLGMIDPPREEVKNSIQVAKNAGITPVMITGDYPNTAFAIAQDLSIANNISEVITGREIDVMRQEEFTQKVLQYKIFARVSPEHKVRIVRALRSHGNIVSMTGDGVNDAPSLNAADIGVAMGITGTDVAKGAADMILLDDNFTTIVQAVEQGRNIYANIKKSVTFLLSCNLGEVIAMFFVLVIGWQSPLLAIQLLWINLVTDSLPAVALGMDRGEKDIMNEKPRNPKDGFFANGAGARTIFFGILVGLATIVAFYLGFAMYGAPIGGDNFATAEARTMAFITLVFAQLFFALSIRSEHESMISRETFSNFYLIGAVALGIILQILIVSIPVLAQIFKLTAIPTSTWLLVTALALVPAIINEIRKFFKTKKSS